MSVSPAALPSLLILVLDLAASARFKACQCRSNDVLTKLKYCRLLLLVLIDVIDGKEVLPFLRQQGNGGHSDRHANSSPRLLAIFQSVNSLVGNCQPTMRELECEHLFVRD